MDHDDTPHPLDALAAATPRDLRALQARLTPVGPRKAPVPSLVFSSFYHLVDPDWFAAPPLDPATVLTFTAAPAELADVVHALAAAPFARQGRAAAPLLAIDLVLRHSRAGDIDAGLVLAGPAARDAVRAVTDALSPANGVGRDVMALFTAAAFAGGPEPGERP
ncbi:hypothetical protein [Specibacter cremeus]|uniref:hypothetical protein n=1 Tax=Specibacter cremeus TaxID=1629051 RepID=UPI000F7B4D6C|nr:hypothetical protein [Specibacter cremeus]